jgi:hypothetical protein
MSGMKVLALAHMGDDQMDSRLAPYLHPIAGRPLIWHALTCLLSDDGGYGRIEVITDADLPANLFSELDDRIDVVPLAEAEEASRLARGEAMVVASGSALITPSDLATLRSAQPGGWIGDGDGRVAAVHIAADDLPALCAAWRTEVGAAGMLDPHRRVITESAPVVVNDRKSLASASRMIRDRLVGDLMSAGVTFLLPESVLVDVDVRIGRDSLIYPGVVLEGQTTIGNETVVGPGCRIISSWVGSGVELKGWNYVAHTSLRNRAILEPYVRRGFD